MAELVQVNVTELLLDTNNPRLESAVSKQQEAALALAAQQGDRLVNLAEDIVSAGSLDPMSLIAVVAVGEDRKRYKVIEGNRRALALKALETPSLVTPALDSKQTKRLVKLADQYASSPLDEVPCALFKDEDEARHWLELRHTGPNGGRGLIQWGSDEKDRFNATHSGSRGTAGQVLDFVDKHGALSNDAKTSNRGIATTLKRLLGTPEVRARLGIDLVQGEIVALYDQATVAKNLTYVVEELKAGRVTVPDVYRVEQRRDFAKQLPKLVAVPKKARLTEPVSLPSLTAGKPTAAPTSRNKRPRARKTPRTTVIPKSAGLNVDPPRINAIYNELRNISTDQYPNAAAVLLRVFLELSTDHYLDTNKVAYKKEDPLAKRIKLVSQDLKTSGDINDKLFKAVGQFADGPSPMAPGVTTFHQYVHNQYVYPKPSELHAAWDGLQPFLEQVWP